MTPWPWSGNTLEIEYAKDAESVFEEADAVLLITEWPEFKSISFEECATRMKTKLVLDGRGQFDQKRLEKSGVKLITLGKSS